MPKIAKKNGEPIVGVTASSSGTATIIPMAHRPTVRIAGPADEREVYRLLLLGHAENALLPANNMKVMYFVKRFLWAAYMPPDDPGPRGIIAVIGQPGCRLQALSMVAIGQYWYTDWRHLEEYIIYVDPEFRRPREGQAVGHAAALLDFLKEQSEKTGLPLLTGIMTKDRMEAKCRLYRRSLDKLGEYFLHLPNGMQWHTDEVLNAVSSATH